jgi:tetratricopeptide (TPR) repeat protein
VLFAVALTPGAGAGTRSGVTPLQYLSTQGYAILRYLRLLIVPYGFTVDPDLPSSPNWWAWLLILAASALAIRWFTKARPGFWFLGGLVLLLPSSSVLAAADLAADRRMYLPMVAFSACLSLLIYRWNRYALAAFCLALALVSFFRTQVWQTEKALWTEAVERSPRKVRPYIQLARANTGPDALQVLEKAQHFAPDNAEVASEMGRLFIDARRPDLALREFGRALALTPNDPAALVNRAVALSFLNQSGAARQDVQRALTINPCLYEARFNATRMNIPLPPAGPCRFTDEQKKMLQAHP